jgi:DNA mismatch endonuclease Vsr
MTDVHNSEQRSRNMAAVRSENTKPELRVRSLLHRLGFRFRLHRKDLPGSPDIVLRSRRTVIFVHGCFWHSHDCKHGLQKPQVRTQFWQTKRDATIRRDERSTNMLQSAGWNVATIWECQTKSDLELTLSIEKALGLRKSGTNKLTKSSTR